MARRTVASWAAMEQISRRGTSKFDSLRRRRETFPLHRMSDCGRLGPSTSGFCVRTIYNILFNVFFVLSSPYYFWRLRRRGNWRPGFRERFGSFHAGLKQALTNRHIIWIHAVSVGEVNLCTQLIHALEPRVPNAKIVVSTTTTTGMAELRQRLPTHISKIYYPIDRRKWVNRALAVINPKAIVLIEAEIWPNFIWRARALGIPLLVANAR